MTGIQLIRRPAFVGIATIMLAAAVQIWLGTGGTWIHPAKSAVNRNFEYSDMAAGFLQGQLSLLTKPPPALLALPDPYDPKVNARYVLWDAVLYNGKYYYYWGPVPAAMIAAVCACLGIANPHLSDECIGICVLLGLWVFETALIFRAKARFCPDQPASAAAVAALSLGLGAPMLVGAATLSIYQTAILAGQFFLVAGLYAAWTGLADGLRPLRLAMAGACWALAAGSRVSLPPALIAVAALTLWHLWRNCRLPNGRAPWSAIAGLLVPLLTGAALLAWFNFARFHSVLEFGFRYQVGGRERVSPAGAGFISMENLLHNLVLYLFRPPVRWHTFPYLVAMEGRTWLKAFFHLAPNIVSEPLVGLLWVQPFLIFAASATPSAENKKVPATQWLVRCLGAALLLGILPILMLDYASMRYVMDGAPCATLLAAIGYFRMIHHRPVGRRLRALVSLLVAAQCVMGVLIAIGYRPDLFGSMIAVFPKL